MSWSNTPPTAIATGTAFSNTAPAAVSGAGVAFSNTAPGAVAGAGTAFSNTVPGAVAYPKYVQLTGAGAVPTEVNGYYVRVDSPLYYGRPYYQSLSNANMLQWDGNLWVITYDLTPPATPVWYYSLSLAGPWQVGPDGVGAPPVAVFTEFLPTAPIAIASGTTPSNTSPGAVTPEGAATPSNTAPLSIATGTTPSNIVPEQYVLPNEQSPIGPAVGPDQPIEVAHTTELDNETNYRVVVGNRGAPVTITLPEPPGIGQWIEIIDASQQAADYPITVDAGAEAIEGNGSTYVMDQPGAVLEIYYTNSNWKIL